MSTRSKDQAIARPVSVIMAGGKGERFWPLSRRDRPKQFLPLLPEGQSLIEATVKRLEPLSGRDRLLVSTSRSLLKLVREYLPDIPEANLIVEPVGRDTAPAVAWAVLEVIRRFGRETVVGFYPADHYIGDPERFRGTVRRATHLARDHEVILTLGVPPRRPATAYGYIEAGEAFAPGAFRVKRFVEKPSRERAEEYLRRGTFYWNAGIFIARAGVLEEEFLRHAPEIIQPLIDRGEAAYPELPKISIDYAVMEKTDRAVVIPADFDWDDLGDWTALERLHGPRQNVEFGRHIGIDTKGAIVYTSDQGEVVVTLGVEDVVIVREGGVTMVVRKDRVQDIKKVLEELRRRNLTEYL